MSVSGDHPQKPTVARVVDSGLKSAAEMLKSLVSLLGDDLEAEERARIVSRLKTEARGLSARAISAMVCDLSQMVLQLRALYSQEVGIVLLEILSQAAALTVRLPSPKSLADPCMSILRVLEGVLLICTAQYAPTKVASVIEKLLRSRRLPWSATTRLEAAMFRLGEEGAYSGVPRPIPLTLSSRLGDGGGFEWLTEWASGSMPGAADKERIYMAKARIGTVVQHVFPNSKWEFFGSSANGFATRLSDIDCVVQLAPSDEAKLLGGAGLAMGDDSPGRMSHKSRKILAEKAAQVLSRAIRTKPELAKSGLQVDALIVEARVPLVKCSSYERVPIDVSFNNMLPLCNSRLLRCYSELDKRVVLLVCLVKTWAKKRCVNDAHLGTLSSYSFTLLVIHYLQRIGLVPNLQSKEAVPEEFHPKVGNTELVDGVHDAWFIDPKCAEAKDFMEARAEPKAVDAQLHGLLAGFFRYFAYEFPIHSHAISIRHDSGKVLKTQLFKDIARKQADALNKAPVSVKEGPTDEAASCAFTEAMANSIGAVDGDAGVAGEDRAGGGSDTSDEEELLKGGAIVDTTGEPALAEQQEPEDGPPATPDLRADRLVLSQEAYSAQRLISGCASVFCIDDPIESGRTLGTTFNGAERLVYEMRRACQILKPGYGREEWEQVLSGVPNPDCQLPKLLQHRRYVPKMQRAATPTSPWTPPIAPPPFPAPSLAATPPRTPPIASPAPLGCAPTDLDTCTPKPPRTPLPPTPPATEVDMYTPTLPRTLPLAPPTCAPTELDPFTPMPPRTPSSAPEEQVSASTASGSRCAVKGQAQSSMGPSAARHEVELATEVLGFLEGSPTVKPTMSSVGFHLKSAKRHLYSQLEGKLRPFVESIPCVKVIDHGSSVQTLALSEKRVCCQWLQGRCSSSSCPHAHANQRGLLCSSGARCSTGHALRHWRPASGATLRPLRPQVKPQPSLSQVARAPEVAIALRVHYLLKAAPGRSMLKAALCAATRQDEPSAFLHFNGKLGPFVDALPGIRIAPHPTTNAQVAMLRSEHVCCQWLQGRCAVGAGCRDKHENRPELLCSRGVGCSEGHAWRQKARESRPGQPGSSGGATLGGDGGGGKVENARRTSGATAASPVSELEDTEKANDPWASGADPWATTVRSDPSLQRQRDMLERATVAEASCATQESAAAIGEEGSSSDADPVHMDTSAVPISPVQTLRSREVAEAELSTPRGALAARALGEEAGYSPVHEEFSPPVLMQELRASSDPLHLLSQSMLRGGVAEGQVEDVDCMNCAGPMAAATTSAAMDDDEKAMRDSSTTAISSSMGVALAAETPSVLPDADVSDIASSPATSSQGLPLVTQQLQELIDWKDKGLLNSQEFGEVKSMIIWKRCCVADNLRELISMERDGNLTVEEYNIAKKQVFEYVAQFQDLPPGV